MRDQPSPSSVGPKDGWFILPLKLTTGVTVPSLSRVVSETVMVPLRSPIACVALTQRFSTT